MRQTTMAITPLTISSYTLSNALGHGVDASLQALLQGHSGLRPCDLDTVELKTWIGRIEGVEDLPLPSKFAAYDCRNNRLSYLALQQDGFLDAARQAVARHGAERIGLFIGTSTSGIATTEQAYQQGDPAAGHLQTGHVSAKTHNICSAAMFIRDLLALRGPTLAISTACSSSAKVFAAAHRYLSMGLCDAALVGGVDSLCMTTLYGFNSLDLISDEPCRPWDADRRGINIGEAAGFVLLQAEERGSTAPRLIGFGESSDAYHMSTPHPQGAGALLAMQQALERAGLTPSDVDYINLHGTATRANDQAEDFAVYELFGDEVRCSSTKGFVGHTLGAAGISEAIFSLLSIEHGFIPQSLHTNKIDPELRINLLLKPERSPLRHVLSNSFGFGGNNCSLLFGSAA